MSNRRQADTAPPGEPVSERWWVDSDRKRGAEARKAAAPAGSRFFSVGAGYDQDRARENLTEVNLKLIRDAEPSEGNWSYVALAEGRCSDRAVERIKKQVALPSYARGVLVDSDGLLRLLITSTPAGERILEMTLGAAPSFDCWIGGEWVDESLFRNEDEALATLRKLVRRYLSPEGAERWREMHPGT